MPRSQRSSGDARRMVWRAHERQPLVSRPPRCLQAKERATQALTAQKEEQQREARGLSPQRFAEGEPLAHRPADEGITAREGSASSRPQSAPLRKALPAALDASDENAAPPAAAQGEVQTS